MKRTLPLVSAIAALALPFGAQPAFAQQGRATLQGQAQATVLDPAGIVAIEDLRFGDIMQPATAGTVTIATNDAISATGGAIAGITTPQTGTRGAGQFDVVGDPGRLFIIFGLDNLPISNGSATMRVDQLRANLFFGFGRFDANGEYLLRVGGRLNIEANQPTGEYSGTYDLTVLYL